MEQLFERAVLGRMLKNGFFIGAHIQSSIINHASSLKNLDKVRLMGYIEYDEVRDRKVS